VNGKTSTSKILHESHPRPTSTSSSSTSSRRSSSTNNPNKSSTSSKSIQNSTSTKTPTPSTNTDSTILDPLAFAAATSGGLTFPYFLPSLLSQATSTNNHNPSTNSTSTYPFSSLSSSLLNPAATLYPFLSPDWFTSSSSKFMDGFANITSDKSIDSKESPSHQTSKSKQSQKQITTENKHLPSLNSLLNESPSSSK
jgi:hypothetical protein